MALFKQLLRLHKGNIPLEDFFTEIVAYLLSQNKEILFDWLSYIYILNENHYLESHVTTQKTYKHPERDDDKRPDIIIELSNGDSYDIIFFESKVGAKEGYNQLSDYAKILDSLPGYRHRYLIYITRVFDPKEQSSVLEEISDSNVKFKQLRWYHFYRFLSEQTNSELIQEIIAFMQEHRMAQSNQFSSVDILALANFPSSLKLMEEVMWGKVLHQYEEVSGERKGIAFRKRDALKRMQEYGHYTLGNWMPVGKWAINLGFFLKTLDPSEYPAIRLELIVAPNSPRRTEIIGEMKKICNQFGWNAHGLDVPSAWSGIACEKSLRDFLAEEDHIFGIENFLLNALKELQDIKQQYPQLPWGSVSDNETETEGEVQDEES